MKTELQRRFWSPMLCDHLPSGLDYFCFDLAFRFTVPLAGRWLNLSIGLRDDEVTGSGCQKCLERNLEALIYELDTLSRRRMHSGLDWKEYSLVRSNRANRARARALALLEVTV